MRRLPIEGAVTALAVLGACAAPARAQSLEPRSFSPAPVGLNFLVVGSAASYGGLSLDALPITNADIAVDTAIVGYARTLDLFGLSAKVDVIAPYGRLSGTASYQGTAIVREVSGWGDPAARLSVILHGAPAETAASFRGYPKGLIVGASLQVSAPLGQYDHAKLLNLGAHRWWVKSEVGVSKARGPWILEVSAAATVYTANDRFFGENRRTQQPLYAAQGHLVYTLRSGVWGSLDTTFYTGGRSTLNGAVNNDLQRNWRVGGTLALPIDRRNSFKLALSKGVSARTGNGYDQITLAFQHRWGGGL